jgi:hypothetical protein
LVDGAQKYLSEEESIQQLLSNLHRIETMQGRCPRNQGRVGYHIRKQCHFLLKLSKSELQSSSRGSEKNAIEMSNKMKSDNDTDSLQRRQMYQRIITFATV